MKNILESKFMISAASNMYRLGWDERNGGNISYLLKDYDLSEYLDLNGVIREIPMGFEAKSLVGQCFLVTGTGKYFKNVESDPENNLGIVRIGKDGKTAASMGLQGRRKVYFRVSCPPYEPHGKT